MGMLDHPILKDAQNSHHWLASLNARLKAEAGAEHFIDPSQMVPAARTEMWSSDRVHMEAAGYKPLGDALAAPVAHLLRAIKR